MTTSKIPTCPSIAFAAVIGWRTIRPDGDRNATSRTSGPASFWTSGRILGPTPFRLETSANSGKRIGGRISHSPRQRSPVGCGSQSAGP